MLSSSSLPSRVSPLGPRPPEDICTVLESPPGFFLVSLRLLWCLGPSQDPSSGTVMPIGVFEVALSRLLALLWASDPSRSLREFPPSMSVTQAGHSVLSSL